ncbi:hypothetical protein IF090_02865 [Acinetobacter towneri]|uniref:hypothetical protein n=1 Tax=Acinetobacter towneri TaxID=202956 RepID=UPI001CE1B6E8|nr:hypothetical protein [Acinetobacter towneri]MCA4778592.1 hypothetical protein [Acinetobacter towneri]MCA4783920.1 hypothetical protein [Acinetobacter towneri]MCA4786422.1 hypothetical protein [Acinetobacter towneri]MCA4795192.1 hypothetical protein [Acinetobacter towneri]MCA4800087.1 hypothetical protein [Acinetobacter towneri]
MSEKYNIELLTEYVKGSNIPQCNWDKILQEVLLPHNLHQPILLRPIVENIISQGDVDLLYPESTIQTYIEYLINLCEKFHLHIFIRAYDKNTVSIKLFDIHAQSWIMLDIHTAIYQLNDKRLSLKWENISNQINTNSVQELDPVIAGYFYLLHLYAQKKKLDSYSVRKRIIFFTDRLKKHHNRKDSEKLIKLLNTTDLIKLPSTQEEAKNRLIELLDLNYDSYLYKSHSSLKRRIKRKWARNALKSKKIMFFGADGAGKTTLMTGLNPSAKILSNLTTHRRGIIYKLAKRKVKKSDNLSQASDIFPLFFFFKSLIYTVFLYLFKSKTYYFDRMPSDILIMNRKSDDIHAHPRAHQLYKLISGFVNIHIIGQNQENFINSKDEMSANQIIKYNQLSSHYMLMGRPLNYLIYRNYHSIEESRETLKKILEISNVRYK